MTSKVISVGDTSCHCSLNYHLAIFIFLDILFFQENSSIVDLVQMMLFPQKARGNEKDPLKKAMTDREVVAQSMTFLLAGYETTSTVLAFFSHVLALHPDVHKKLSKEIEQKVGQVG